MTIKTRLAKLEAEQEHKRNRVKFAIIKGVCPSGTEREVIGYNGQQLKPGQTLEELADEIYDNQENDMIILVEMYEDEN
ncbi:hypothetical protein MASR1M90_14510 [Desulfovibrionales bacterium]